MDFSHLSVCVQCILSTSANLRFLHAQSGVLSCSSGLLECVKMCARCLYLKVENDGLINISVGSVLWKWSSNSLWECVWEKRGKRYLSEIWGKGIELNLSGSTVHLSSVKCAQASIKHTSRFSLLLPLRNTVSLRFSSWNKVWYHSNSTFNPSSLL